MATTASATTLFGDLKDSYLFADSEWGNPKPTISSAGVTGNLLGIIYGQGGSAQGPPGAKDSGELFFNTSPEKPTVYAVRGSIILPNMAGYSSLEIGAWGGFPNMIGAAEHNTWFGGYIGTTKGGTNGNFGFPALQMGEGYKPKTGQIASFRSNILWNPQLPGRTGGFAKLADVGNGWNNPDPGLDSCLPENCDYNAGWGYTAANPAARQYTNQGKGYVAKFSELLARTMSMSIPCLSITGGAWNCSIRATWETSQPRGRVEQSTRSERSSNGHGKMSIGTCR